MQDSSSNDLPGLTLVLASQSPRRSELLRQIGVEFKCYPVDIDESPHPEESASDLVLRLAVEKAQAAHQRYPRVPNHLFLGADTIGLLDDKVLAKPRNFYDFASMLRKMSGRTHQVLSAVALVGDGFQETILDRSDVTFRTIRECEIEQYWHSGEPQDKAGGYGIQGLGAIFVEKIIGSYSGIVGLPLQSTAELLRMAGIQVWNRVEGKA
ncbi:septum formation protein Maf [Oleiphilus messinensis]|uniref:dTTP/UTP pyrophosphatase n=1 Tax=Oleiphilus messinensis TaxID=141451 RepID=A0A1Y0I863_9GAMM|nr:nucleoside triphosphate pyrophosphatase [Oleiphilus messinensis]ARU55956.1 septum formation protein Maf [Oleiphilus messinensis]